MADRIADMQSPRQMFQPPQWLEDRTRQQQEIAPNCGLGFKRGRLAPEVHEAMRENLRRHAPQFRPEQHIDEIGTVEPRFFPAMLYEDREFNAAVSAALQPGHEAWSGMELQESACYGFRIYQRGCYLHNHVDVTSTHIVSSTICVDSHLDEPWPLYVEDNEGHVHLLNLDPGEFVYYEGARLVHGRPWPLIGDYYVGLFVHYRPVGMG